MSLCDPGIEHVRVYQERRGETPKSSLPSSLLELKLGAAFHPLSHFAMPFHRNHYISCWFISLRPTSIFEVSIYFLLFSYFCYFWYFWSVSLTLFDSWMKSLYLGVFLFFLWFVYNFFLKIRWKVISHFSVFQYSRYFYVLSVALLFFLFYSYRCIDENCHSVATTFAIYNT